MGSGCPLTRVTRHPSREPDLPLSGYPALPLPVLEIARIREFSFPCCEIVPSASNRLITVAVSISTPSLSLIESLDKAATLPPTQVRFRKHYCFLVLLSVPYMASSIHYRPTSGNTVA